MKLTCTTDTCPWKGKAVAIQPAFVAEKIYCAGCNAVLQEATE